MSYLFLKDSNPYLDGLDAWLTAMCPELVFASTIGCIGQVEMARLAAKTFDSAFRSVMRSASPTTEQQKNACWWQVGAIKLATHTLLAVTFYAVGAGLFVFVYEHDGYWTIAVYALVAGAYASLAAYCYLPTLLVASTGIASLEDNNNIAPILQKAWLLAKGKRLFLISHSLVSATIVYGIGQLCSGGGHLVQTSLVLLIVTRLPFLFAFPLFSM